MFENLNITRLGVSVDFLTYTVYWITCHILHAMGQARGPKTLGNETCSG